MESRDPDKIFRQKVEEGSARYAGDAREAKERIWNRINPVSGKKQFEWLKYAAAIILLFATSGVFVGVILHSKNTKIQALTAQVAQLNKDLKSQQRLVNNQQTQITQLDQRLQQVKILAASLTPKSTEKPVVSKEIKYVVDTVFLETIPKITQTPVRPMEKRAEIPVQENKIAKIMVENTPQANQVRFILPDQKPAEGLKTGKEQTKLRWGNSSDENAPARSLTFKIKL